jgi:two-component system LytT family response regulator
MSDQTKISILIVDDEDLARRRIRELVEKHPELELLSECATGTQAVAAITRLHPQIVFLDIQMPDLNGLEVVRKLQAASMPLIIFITAYDEFAVNAFELHACDYLLKPFKKKRFEEALLRAKNDLRTRNKEQWIQRTYAMLESLSTISRYLDRFTIKERGRIFFVKARDVDWIEAEDNYVRIHTGKEEYLIRQQIGQLQRELDPSCFIRIHRGAIVNVERIQELQQWFKRDYRIVLRNGTVLPLGRSYRKGLREALHSEF